MSGNNKPTAGQGAVETKSNGIAAAAVAPSRGTHPLPSVRARPVLPSPPPPPLCHTQEMCDYEMNCQELPRPAIWRVAHAQCAAVEARGVPPPVRRCDRGAAARPHKTGGASTSGRRRCGRWHVWARRAPANITTMPVGRVPRNAAARGGSHADKPAGGRQHGQRTAPVVGQRRGDTSTGGDRKSGAAAVSPLTPQQCRAMAHPIETCIRSWRRRPFPPCRRPRTA